MVLWTNVQAVCSVLLISYNATRLSLALARASGEGNVLGVMPLTGHSASKCTIAYAKSRGIYLVQEGFVAWIKAARKPTLPNHVRIEHKTKDNGRKAPQIRPKEEVPFHIIAFILTSFFTPMSLVDSTMEGM